MGHVHPPASVFDVPDGEQGSPVGVLNALLKAREWTTWLEAHLSDLADSEPAIRFVVEATLKLHQAHVRHARVLRMNPTWDVQGSTPFEDRPVVPLAQELLAWFEQNQPSQFLLPDWGRFLLTALHGSFKQHLRQARELDQLRRRSYVLVNVAPVDPGDLGEEQP